MPYHPQSIGGDPLGSSKARRMNRDLDALHEENERYKSQLRQIDDAVEGMKYEMDDGFSQPLIAYERLKQILSEVQW